MATVHLKSVLSQSKYMSPEFHLEAAVQLGVLTVLINLRSSIISRLKALRGEHTLSMSNLNKAVIFKEVFLAYLNAGTHTLMID